MEKVTELVVNITIFVAVITVLTFILVVGLTMLGVAWLGLMAVWNFIV